MKRCLRCREIKNDDEFNQHKDRHKQTWCKKCSAEYSRQWYAANRKSHIQYVAEHRSHKTHTCKHCERCEPEVRFYIKREAGQYYRRFICCECDRAYRKKYPSRPESLKRERERRAAKNRVARQSGDKRFMFICQDSKKRDRKRGHDNDLDWGFVKEQIAKGCTYCGDTTCKMTMDRIDNGLGHTKSNVVACCMRCNWFRRDMPYEAWLVIVPALRKAVKRGLLDEWNAGTKMGNPRRSSDPKAIGIATSI